MEDRSSSNNSTPIQQTTAPSPIPCTICRSASRGMAYGVIACEACKVFFKRNSQRGLHVLQCHFDGHCQINIHTRHSCTYCRLAKCLEKGMQTELIRCPRSTTNKSNGKRKTPDDEVQIKSIVLRRTTAQMPTLNLLRTDQSTLTLDHWNLLSNLSHCFDDHAGLSIGQRYMSEQHNLPPRFRFKSGSIIQLYQMIIDGTEMLYKNNRDFLSLCAEDRSILLQNTSGPSACLCMNFIGYKIELMNYPAYFDALEVICTAQIAAIGRRLSLRLNFDLVIIKLFLAIISFSTYRFVGYLNNDSKNFKNTQEIQRIQDGYIEVTWRYLLYKYDHEQAVKCFSEFIRCIFLMNSALVISEEIQWFHEKVDSMSKKTEESLSLNG